MPSCHFPTSVLEPILHASSFFSFHTLPKFSEDERLWKQGKPKCVSVQPNLEGDWAWPVNSELCWGRLKFITKISLDPLTVPLEFLLQFADLIALYSASRQSFHFLWFQCCFKTRSSPGIYHLEQRKSMFEYLCIMPRYCHSQDRGTDFNEGVQNPFVNPGQFCAVTLLHFI